MNENNNELSEKLSQKFLDLEENKIQNKNLEEKSNNDKALFFKKNIELKNQVDQFKNTEQINELDEKYFDTQENLKR